MTEYPGWIYGDNGEGRIVHSEAARIALAHLANWYDTPTERDNAPVAPVVAENATSEEISGETDPRAALWEYANLKGISIKKTYGLEKLKQIIADAEK